MLCARRSASLSKRGHSVSLDSRSSSWWDWGRWGKKQFALAGAAVATVWVIAILIPGAGLFYNDEGHKAYDRDDFATAERYHLKAIAVIPNHPLFLDNLGMVYLQQFTEMAIRGCWHRRKILRPRDRGESASLDPHIHMETVLVRSLTADADHDRDVYKEIAEVDAELLAIDPFVPFARKNLASAYYNLGQFDHALLELQKAIEYEPNYVPGYLQMSERYTERGDAIAGQRYMATAMNIITSTETSNRPSRTKGFCLGGHRNPGRL